MKKKLIFSILSITGLFSYGQETSLGDLSKKIFLGGSLGYVQNKSNQSLEAYTAHLAPVIGYFFTESFVGGVATEYKYTHKKFTTNEKENEHTFSAKPFIRKYWMTDQRFMPSVELNGSFGWLIDSQNRDKGKNGKYTWGIHIEPGFSYQLSSSVFLDAGIGRLGYDYSGKNDKSYSVKLDMSAVKLGANFFL